MDHLHHFGLSEDPFRNEPLLRFCVATREQGEASRRLERGVRQAKGLCVLTGDVGSGKTMIVRRLFEALEEEVFDASMMVVLHGAADSGWLLSRFARQLGIEEPARERESLLAEIYERLAIVREDGRHAVLIIDDAQALAARDTLHEMCGLLKLEYEDRRLLTLVLAASVQLDEVLASDPALARRVDVRVRLEPFDAESASAFLAHRVRQAGGDPTILEPGAMRAIAQLGCGCPGLMNTLADNALYEAYLRGRATVTRKDVERAHSDLAWDVAAPVRGPGGDDVALRLRIEESGAREPSSRTDAAPEGLPNSAEQDASGRVVMKPPESRAEAFAEGAPIANPSQAAYAAPAPQAFPLEPQAFPLELGELAPEANGRADTQATGLAAPDPRMAREGDAGALGAADLIGTAPLGGVGDGGAGDAGAGHIDAFGHPDPLGPEGLPDPGRAELAGQVAQAPPAGPAASRSHAEVPPQAAGLPQAGAAPRLRVAPQPAATPPQPPSDAFSSGAAGALGALGDLDSELEAVFEGAQRAPGIGAAGADDPFASPTQLDDSAFGVPAGRHGQQGEYGQEETRIDAFGFEPAPAPAPAPAPGGPTVAAAESGAGALEIELSSVHAPDGRAPRGAPPKVDDEVDDLFVELVDPE